MKTEDGAYIIVARVPRELSRCCRNLTANQSVCIHIKQFVKRCAASAAEASSSSSAMDCSARARAAWQSLSVEDITRRADNNKTKKLAHFGLLLFAARVVDDNQSIAISMPSSQLMIPIGSTADDYSENWIDGTGAQLRQTFFARTFPDALWAALTQGII